MELSPALGWRASLGRQPAVRPCRPSLAPRRRLSPSIKAVPSDEDRPSAPGSSFNAGKDPHRMVDDTTDEEFNLPENPLNLDEDMMVPQRPGIEDVYRDATHSWPPLAADTSPMVGDTTDEESVRPDDPLDMDDDLINVPQRPFAADIYESLPGHPRAPRRHRDVAVTAESDQGKEKEHHVASGLPPPDPTAHMVPSLSSGDEELAEEVATGLRFEGVSDAVRDAREEAARGGECKSASGLPPPDPNASSVASLDSDDEKFRFEGAGQAAREAREEHRRHEVEHGVHTAGASDEKNDSPEKESAEGEAPIPGSHEAPEVAPPDTGDRERRMEQAERGVTEMGGSGHSAAHADPRPRDRLPGLITEDTTFLHNADAENDRPDAIEEAQSDREERLQGLMEGIEKIKDDEKHRQEPLHPDLHDALLGDAGSDAVDASLAAMEGEEEESAPAPGGGPGTAGSDPHDWPEGDPDSPTAAAALGDDAPTALPDVSFEFKSEKGKHTKSGTKSTKSRSMSALSHGAQVLRSLAAKAAAAAAERSEDPLARLSAAREAAKAHHEAAAEALRRRRPSVTAARVAEVAAGRAAVIGLASAATIELLLRQSVMSQLLGRWEGWTLVETAVPSARSAAAAVLAISLVAAATEALLAQSPPPTFPLAGLSPRAQLWAGRAAMLTFTALVVWEVAHSNRPALPTFFLW